MCLIIHRDDNSAINPVLVAQGMNDNPHGWGIMIPANGRIVTLRGMDMESFPETLASIGDIPLSIHFRYATHGTKNVDNCHPFDILGGAYSVMHNGVIDVPLRDKGRSDTYHFANHILAPILAHDPGAFGTPYLEKLIGSIIGCGNKLVILRADGATMIVNEHEGSWQDGLWLSNRHSLPITGRIGHSLLSADPKYRLSAWRDDEFDDWNTNERIYRDDSDDLIPIDDIDGNDELVEMETIKTDRPATRPAVRQFNEYDLMGYADLEYEEIRDYAECDPDAVATAIWSFFNENQEDADTYRPDAR